MSRFVAADTGPSIHLAQANVLHSLEPTGELLLPQTVLDELERGSTDISELEFTVGQVEYDDESTYPQLDPGETAALVLCSEREAVIQMDDSTNGTRPVDDTEHGTQADSGTDFSHD